MFLDHPGRFRAVCTAIGVSKTGTPPKTTVTIGHDITDEYINEEWVDVRNHLYQIRSYHYIQKKGEDGRLVLNTQTVDNLKAALGWSGSRMADILTAEGAGVQLKCDTEEYQGKTRIKVRYMNHWDYEGGGDVQSATPDELRQIENELGPQLRAHSGAAMSGPVGKAAPKPADKPRPGRPVNATPPPASPTARTQEIDRGEIWNLYKSVYGDEARAWWAWLEKHAGTADLEKVPSEKLGGLWARISEDVRAAEKKQHEGDLTENDEGLPF